MQFWKVFFDSIAPTRHHSDGPMARMFRTEYGRDYRNAVENGATVSEEYARGFMNRINL